jgi:H+/Cl- antiporter ClcA
VRCAVSCKLILALDKLRRQIVGWLPQLVFVLGLSLLFAAVVFTFGRFTTGSGDALLEHYLFAKDPAPHWKDAVGRVLGSVVTMGGGGAGGVFAPALSSGAAIGGLFGSWFGEDRGELNLMILGGMCAFLAGVTRSPFTSAILVLEMTDRHSVIFQLMYASMIASVVAHSVDTRSYYERMKNRLLDLYPGIRRGEQQA